MRHGNADRMLWRARSGQEGPARAPAKSGHKGQNHQVPKEVRRPDLAREGGVSPQGPQPAGASPRAREPASLGARAAAALVPRPGAAPGGQERARGSAGPRSRPAAGSAGGRGRARSGAGSALGPQRGAGEKRARPPPSKQRLPPREVRHQKMETKSRLPCLPAHPDSRVPTRVRSRTHRPRPPISPDPVLPLRTRRVPWTAAHAHSRPAAMLVRGGSVSLDPPSLLSL